MREQQQFRYTCEKKNIYKHSVHKKRISGQIFRYFCSRH